MRLLHMSLHAVVSLYGTSFGFSTVRCTSKSMSRPKTSVVRCITLSPSSYSVT